MIMLPGAGSSNPLSKTWNTLKATAQVKKARELVAKYILWLVQMVTSCSDLVKILQGISSSQN